jgi:uncharacterized protein YggU (UPF0235/DUF167 family)
MVKWKELVDDERKKRIEEARKLREEGHSYMEIVKIFKEKYSVEVSSITIYQELNPEKKANRLKAQQNQREVIKANRDYILSEIRRRLEEGKNKEEIAKGLSEELNVIPSRLIDIASAIEKILKNPEKSAGKILTPTECWNISPMGKNYIREKIGLPVLHQIYGDSKRVYEALKEGPLTSDEIKGMMKGKSDPRKIIDRIRTWYGVEILSEHIPFTGTKCIYFLPEHRERAVERAMEEAFKNCENQIKHLRRYNFDEEGEEALLYILSLPFVREDDKAFRKLKNYKGAFNRLQCQTSLKHVELDGKKYYSFWNYGLENAKILSELTRELFDG